MKEFMKQMWNDKYRGQEFAYGELPNNYLKEQLVNIKAKTILFPAEGEGRNAIYAAKLGLNVFAFDMSIEGQKKAFQLAKKNNVTINYEVGEVQKINYKEEQFDVIALIYVHFPPNIRSLYHKIFNSYLSKGGIIIFEAFSKAHIEYNSKNAKVGGPKDIDLLYSIEQIKEDFTNYEFKELVELEIELNEGTSHIGKASVIRFVATKK